MEFLVEFELNVPEGTPESEVEKRVSAEAAASAALARDGHLERLEATGRTWREEGCRPLPRGDATATRHASGRAAAQPMDAGQHHTAPATPQRSRVATNPEGGTTCQSSLRNQSRP
jgi:muconolactone delta-isomerase